MYKNISIEVEKILLKMFDIFQHICMVAYFCHHFSDLYELSDLISYSFVKKLILKKHYYPVNAIQKTNKLSKKST